VKRLWYVSSSLGLSDQSQPTWTCQLIRAEVGKQSLLLDLIALEPCPVTAVDCGRYVPFTLQVGRRGDPDDSSNLAIAAWAEDADIVTISAGADARRSWLRLSSGQRHLVLAVDGER
jgi:hypothetical protein